MKISDFFCFFPGSISRVPMYYKLLSNIIIPWTWLNHWNVFLQISSSVSAFLLRPVLIGSSFLMILKIYQLSWREKRICWVIIISLIRIIILSQISWILLSANRFKRALPTLRTALSWETSHPLFRRSWRKVSSLTLLK